MTVYEVIDRSTDAAEPCFAVVRISQDDSGKTVTLVFYKNANRAKVLCNSLNEFRNSEL